MSQQLISPNNSCDCSRCARIYDPVNGSRRCHLFDGKAPIYRKSTDKFATTTADQVLAQKVRPERVFEEDGWWIERVLEFPEDGSWVAHYCPSAHVKISPDVYTMVNHGVCHYCCMTVPPEIIALWKLHNWDALQRSHKVIMTPPVPTPIIV